MIIFTFIVFYAIMNSFYMMLESSVKAKNFFTFWTLKGASINYVVQKGRTDYSLKNDI